MGSAPLLGIVGSLIKDWVPLIDEYYYCEAAEFRFHLLTVPRYCIVTTMPIYTPVTLTKYSFSVSILV